MKDFLLVICCGLLLHASAQDALLSSGKLDHIAVKYTAESRAAACAPATALRDLEWNNIDALIETGGSLWQDRANGRSHYFAPKNGDAGVMFAGSLWLGGVSPDQQLKLAALLYRYSGNDYWPGPLSNDGAAEITANTCLQWDKFAVSLRTDAALHRQYHDCSRDPACDMSKLFPNGYSMPSYFNDYPAHGNVALGQDFYIAPFYDYNNNGVYEPESGDYPWYDLTREIDCKGRRREDIVPLYGDQTYYWVFNDKGNIHTETGGQAIGMEIRAQAFAFSTNDEVNNMTFYNYVLINQGSQTLQDTYFGTWIDLDIGGHVDDYVGCDVQRGLGYGYNGDAFDDPTALSLGYGASPPAVGVDFFEGPYQDEDEIDNPLTTDILQAIDQKGIPYKGIGIGYGDSIIDNERFGMRKFLYHNSGLAINGPPQVAAHYYNYLRGFWKNGQRMAYGGNALTEGSGADLSIPADFMFPGDTDPFHFGTAGVVTEPWTEISSGNPPADRRFMQSAGPFTLEPGDYNNITVGVVWARATSGDPFASVEAVRIADDKAQALFDNCFELISGPDAPDVAVCELSNEIILQWTNDNPLSNNFHEQYSLIDPTIPELSPEGEPYSEEQRSYSFQGYMVYQLADENVTASDLEDITRARLISQCDVQDQVSTLINYKLDATTEQIVPQLKVQGANEGVFHSLRVTTDAFALGAPQLVNHKTYYFMVIAYGYNNYADFSFTTLGGQDETFLPSRKATLLEIPVIRAIPHNVAPENGGTIINAGYGDGVPLVRIEGTGNSKNLLNLSSKTEN
ncbi:MAG: T9SS C-terminal target domain-containing protein, partial [Flavobacteriales bacterium]